MTIPTSLDSVPRAVEERRTLLGLRPGLLGVHPALFGLNPRLLESRLGSFGSRPGLLELNPRLLESRPNLSVVNPRAIGFCFSRVEAHSSIVEVRRGV